MNRITKRLDYISNANDTLDKVFIGMESILYVDNSNEIWNEIIDTQIHKLFIVEFTHEADGDLARSFENYNTVYELLFDQRSFNIINEIWDVEVYSCYVGHIYLWWYQKRKNSIPVHSFLTDIKLD